MVSAHPARRTDLTFRPFWPPTGSPNARKSPPGRAHAAKVPENSQTTSPTGAQGLLQAHPGTLKRCQKSTLGTPSGPGVPPKPLGVPPQAENATKCVQKAAGTVRFPTHCFDKLGRSQRTQCTPDSCPTCLQCLVVKAQSMQAQRSQKRGHSVALTNLGRCDADQCGRALLQTVCLRRRPMVTTYVTQTAVPTRFQVEKYNPQKRGLSTA